MTALFITFAIAVAGTYFAWRARQLLFHIGAAVAWFALWAMLKEHPPIGVTEGEAAHILILYAPIIMGIGVMMMGLVRQVNWQKDYRGNFTFTGSDQRFPKLFGLGKDEEDIEDETRQRKGKKSKEDELEEYKMKMRTALRGERRRRR